jgi:hypothetical protein
MVAACIPRKSFAAKKNIAAVILVNQGKSPITVFSKAK